MADTGIDGADRPGEEEDDLVIGLVPEGDIPEVLHVVPLPLDLLLDGPAGLVVDQHRGAFLGRLFQLGEDLELDVEGGGGGDEALHLADGVVHVFREGAEAGGVDPTGKEVRVDLLEAEEGRVGAVAAEAGGDGGDAIEVVKFLGEGQHKEVRLVGGDKEADCWGGEGLGAESCNLGVEEGAVQVDSPGHGISDIEAEDPNGVVAVLRWLPVLLLPEVGDGGGGGRAVVQERQ